VLAGGTKHPSYGTNNREPCFFGEQDDHAYSRVVIAVGRRYVRYINQSDRRTGTLWDSRYKSSPVQAETSLLLCQRYIEMNPVRAAMVADPAEGLDHRSGRRVDKR